MPYASSAIDPNWDVYHFSQSELLQYAIIYPQDLLAFKVSFFIFLEN